MSRLHFIFFLMVITGVSCSSVSSSDDSSQAVVDSTTDNGVTAERPTFDVDSAMAFIKSQVDFGPRVPGSASHRQCADWLSARLASFGGQVTDTTVLAFNPATRKNVPVRNIFAQFNPEATNRIILLAHYDTRPWADEDPDSSNHSKPIDGANDGASGVGVALEIGRHAALLPQGSGLDILLVDMEDSGTHDIDGSWCIGSTRWAMVDMPYKGARLPRFGILLDMVGGRDAVFPREYFSELYAPEINDMVHNAAVATGHESRFPNSMGGAITDDHLPLLNNGIPTVDIIETRVEGGSGGFNPTWHTMMDNFDNIDPATIGAVGDVLMYLIY